MPAYNVGLYIGKAIESVINQSFQDWELIIVDDGSSDETYSIAEFYSKKDNRIRVEHKKNGGLSDARNFGLNKAIGEYVHFFDPDDYLLDLNFYSKLFAYIESKKIDILITGYHVGTIHKNHVETIYTVYCPTTKNGKFDMNSNVNPIKFVCYAWNKLFRRQFLINNELFYEKGLNRIEDTEFMSRLVKYKPSFSFIKDGGYVYVQRELITLSRGYDDTLIANSKRRIYCDLSLYQYFLNPTEDELYWFENMLKTACVKSVLNRLYDKQICKSMTYVRRRNCLQMLNDSLPAMVCSFNNNTLSNLFTRINIYLMRQKVHFITEFSFRLKNFFR